ncbi:MAG: hypothetical protein AABY09_05730, partial [Nanoarchaeota archaeon]
GEKNANALVDKAVKEGLWGCGSDCSKFVCGDALRQAKNSIMRDHDLSKEWGPVSIVIIREKLRKYAYGSNE